MYTFRFSGLFPWKRQGTAGSPCPSPGPGLRPPTPEGTRTAPATVSLFAWVLICSQCAVGPGAEELQIVNEEVPFI